MKQVQRSQPELITHVSTDVTSACIAETYYPAIAPKTVKRPMPGPHPKVPMEKLLLLVFY